MIAIGLFFMVAFSVLALVSQSLRQARALRFATAPVGSVAAETSLTNRLEEGFETGDFEEVHPEHTWEREVTEAYTNGLYQVDMAVFRKGNNQPEGRLSILLFRPESAAGPRAGQRLPTRQ